MRTRIGHPIPLPFLLFGAIVGHWSAASCTPTAALNLLAPTSTFSFPSGLPVPKSISVGFVNNTPFRAIFTFGSFDPLDQSTSPTNFGQLRIEGSTSSAQQLQPCRKTFSVGSDELVRLINVNDLPVGDPRALIRGVNLSNAPIGDPLEAEPTEGTAAGVEVRNGVDYGCEDLLLFTFEQDITAPGGFRVDYALVEAE